jgi:hypothetical protein
MNETAKSPVAKAIRLKWRLRVDSTHSDKIAVEPKVVRILATKFTPEGFGSLKKPLVP